MNIPLIIANWKCNKNIDESLEWLRDFAKDFPKKRGEIIICPPFSSLSVIRREVLANNWPISLGAQNIAPFEGGSYTGEISAAIIRDLVAYVIIGHSERRRWFRETDKEVTEKIRLSIKNRITPIVCVSSNDEVGQWRTIPESTGSTIIVGFEPLEVIGTGASENPEYVNEVSRAIKALLSGWKKVYVVYGGSVNPENVHSFIRQKEVDGVLVGSASLHPATFRELVKNVSR